MIAPDWLDVVELLLAPSLIETQRAPCLVHSVCSSASKFALRQELGGRGILGRGAHKVAVSESLEVSPLLVLGGGNVVSILCVLLSSPILG